MINKYNEVIRGTYELDYIENNDIKSKGYILPALTEKNRDFIEGIIKVDSNYGPDDDANVVNSTAYWFKQLQNGCDFKEFAYGVVESIDRTNSTHLMVCEDGRKRMSDRIIRNAGSKEELIKFLNDNDISNPNHLFYKLLEPLKAIKGSDNYNLSFVSKFFSYCSYYLKANDNFSKYDKVVSSVLHFYVKNYLNESIKKNKVCLDNYIKKPNNDGLQIRLELYKRYNDYIGKIIEVLKNENIVLDRNAVDHIIWYSGK